MSEEDGWRVADCIVGPNCWCGIIVSPNGEECNDYGEIYKQNCQFIIDAMNGNQSKQYRRNNHHPLPWHVMEGHGGRKWMTTTAGLTSDDMDHFVGSANGDYNRIFVEAVNGFYEYDEKKDA